MSCLYRYGEPGSRWKLNTPSLVLDLDALHRNITVMAHSARGFRKHLRPHAKSHKCSTIARLQIEAGAVGVCCATLDEAEVMTAAGIPGILITSPITTTEKINRLMALMRKAPETMLVVDHPNNVSYLGAAARRAGVTLQTLIDVDLGFGRTGVLNEDDAEALAHAIRAEEALTYAGVQAYGGHLQHIVDDTVRFDLARKAGAFIAGIVARLARVGMDSRIITGGGTGTHAVDGRSSPFTENQAGSYIFMDAEYEAVTYEQGKDWPFLNSLFVQTAIISGNMPDSVTTDAGTKAFALNGPKPRIVNSSLAGASYTYTGDEHGKVVLSPGMIAPALGDRLECVVSHCDPTVALYDQYHCVRGDVLVDVWRIDARGRTLFSNTSDCHQP